MNEGKEINEKIACGRLLTHKEKLGHPTNTGPRKELLRNVCVLGLKERDLEEV